MILNLFPRTRYVCCIGNKFRYVTNRVGQKRCLNSNGSHQTGSGPVISNAQLRRHMKTNCQVSENGANFSRIISYNEQTLSKQQLPIGQVNIELNDLELDLQNGHKMMFNLTWLRDSCQCELCTHQHSRQRLFLPKHFRRHMFGLRDVILHQDLSEEIRKRFCWPSFGSNESQVSTKSSDFSHLELNWSDGHQSFYSLNWLEKIATIYKEDRYLDTPTHKGNSNFRFPQDDFYMPQARHSLSPFYWSVEQIRTMLEPVDFYDLIDGFDFRQFNDATFINANKAADLSSRRLEAMSCLTKQLITFGLAKIVNVPQERDQVLSVVRSLAYERPTGYGTVFDVIVEPSEEINLAYSTQEFDLHIDLPYREHSPGVQLLHCIRNSSTGGLSYFCDAFNAANQLKQSHKDLYQVLLEFPVTFVVRDPYRDVKFRRQQPILSLDFQGNLSEIHYSPFMLPPIGHKDDVKLFYLAIDTYTQILQSPQNKFISKMEPGELYIFHNRRVLHGRSSYDLSSGNRFLQGCYMDWDEIKCLYEKLCSASKSRS